MSTLERIIRPFQTLDRTPPKRVLTDYEKPGVGTDGDEEKIILTIGKGGSGKTLNSSENFTHNRYMDTHLKEVSITASFGS